MTFCEPIYSQIISSCCFRSQNAPVFARFLQKVARDYSLAFSLLNYRLGNDLVTTVGRERAKFSEMSHVLTRRSDDVELVDRSVGSILCA